MIYKNKSSKEIVRKLYTDFGIKESSYVNYMMEWIGEALNMIGNTTQFVPKTAELTVADNRVELPCDFQKNLTVEYDGEKLLQSESRTTDEEYNYSSSEYYYLIPNYIVTSFESGTIKIYYDAFPVDDEGFPLMPDEVHYKEALTFYCLYKLLGRGYQHPVFNYESAFNQWMYYKVRAINKGKNFTKDRLKMFEVNWVKFWPHYHARYDTSNIASSLYSDTLEQDNYES